MSSLNVQLYVLVDTKSQKFFCDYRVYGSIPLSQRIVLSQHIADAKIFSSEKAARQCVNRWEALQDDRYEWAVWEMTAELYHWYPVNIGE